MSDFDNEPDQEKRIEKLRAQLEKLGGEVSDNSQLSADMEEEFLKHILAFETTESTSLLQWLENAGQDVPPPDELDDSQLHAKLWEVINRMASLGAYLHNTNHLGPSGCRTFLTWKCHPTKIRHLIATKIYPSPRLDSYILTMNV